MHFLKGETSLWLHFSRKEAATEPSISSISLSTSDRTYSSSLLQPIEDKFLPPPPPFPEQDQWNTPVSLRPFVSREEICKDKYFYLQKLCCYVLVYSMMLQV